MRRTILLVLIVLLVQVGVFATDFSWQLKNQLVINPVESLNTNYLSSFQLSLSKSIGNSGNGYLTLEGDYDSISEVTSFTIGEAIVKFYRGSFEFDTGLGYTSWGTADGINPTDIVNPPMISDSFLSIDKKPILRSKITFYGDSLTITGVVNHEYVPVDFKKFKALAPEFNGVPLPQSLEKSLKNQEYALQLEAYLSGIDLKLSYFNGYDDWPEVVYTFLINPLSGEMVPGSDDFHVNYRKQSQIGLAVASTLKSTGVWAEASYVMPEVTAFESDNPLRYFFNLSPTDSYLRAVLGADYSFNEFYTSIQYLYFENGSILVPYTTPNVEVKALHGIMFRSTYSINPDFNLETTVIGDITNNAHIFVPELVYNGITNTSLKLTYIKGNGESGELSKNQDSIRFLVSTSF